MITDYQTNVRRAQLASVYEPESEWLLKYCEGAITSGDHNVYVDLGCSHPINKSLTSFVRDLGWRGVAIDGNHDYEKDWDAASFGHHFCCSILSDQPRARFVVHENSFTSRLADEGQEHPEKWGIARVVEAQAKPLNEILASRNIGKIDLLTVDLEGFEYRILKTLDWEKHQPKFVIAEYATEGVGIDPSVANLLIGLGYEVIQMFESNLIFQRK